jgi:replicative DNA helicase
MQGETVPVDLEAEKTFLGGLMLAAEVNHDHLQVVQADDFFDRRHQLIYRAILEEVEAVGSEAPSLAVVDRLRRQGALNTAGGAAYIDEVVEAQVIPKGGLAKAGQIVAEQAQLRQLITVAQEIIVAAREKETDLEEKLDAAEQRVLEIRGRREKGAGMINMTELMRELTTKMSTGDWGQEHGLKSGISRLDRYLGGLQPGHLVILGARPGMGKTSLALSLAANAARLNNAGVAVFSLEMPAPELVERLLASTARINMLELKRNPPSFDSDPDRFFHVMNRIGDALAALDNTAIHVDDSPAISIGDLRHRVRQLAANLERQDPPRKLGLVVIDYLQLMRSTSVARNRSREQEVAEISKGLKGLAKEVGVCVMALSQLRRQVEQEGAVGDDGKNKGDREPRLSDLRESGSIEQDADSVLALHAAPPDPDAEEAGVEDAGTVKLLVLKNRHGDRGAVMLNFTKEYTLFTEQTIRRDHPDSAE